jgi:hypothetical protein
MTHLDAREIFVPIFAIGCVFGIPIIAIVMYWWYEIRKVTSEAALKQAMVERGYSANEIVHVLTSGNGKGSNPAYDLPPAKPLKAAAVGL